VLSLPDLATFCQVRNTVKIHQKDHIGYKIIQLTVIILTTTTTTVECYRHQDNIKHYRKPNPYRQAEIKNCPKRCQAMIPAIHNTP